MGKVGLIPCGRHHRRWCRGRRRCCLRSLWCLWFPCTSPEKKRLLPHMLKILKPVLQRRKWRRQGGEASWWPPGSVSQTGTSSTILYSFLLGIADTCTCGRLQNQDIMDIIPPVVHVVVQVCRICDTGAREHMNHIYCEYPGDPSCGLFQQIWLGCHPSDSEALITIRCF